MPTTTNPRLDAMRAELAFYNAHDRSEFTDADRRRVRVLEDALRAYDTDGELEAAERLAGAQDFTDGGGYVDADGCAVVRL